MGNNFVQIVFTLAAVIVLAAAQDMLPAFCGTKAPLLMLFVLQSAFDEPRRNLRQNERFTLPRWLPTAVLAGAFEDALSGFPAGCSMAFMPLAGLAARFMRSTADGLPAALVGLASATVAAPLHELWMAVWDVLSPDSAPAVRFFASALPAAPAGAALFAALPALRRHAGFAWTEEAAA